MVSVFLDVILIKELLEMAKQNGARLIKEKVIDVQKRGKLWKIETAKTVLTHKISYWS